MNRYPKQGLSGKTPKYLHWLIGNWKGVQDESQIEEYWSPYGGGTLMAMFRWIKNQTVLFYEFITIEQENEHVILRIKHFYPKMQGWEEKDKSIDFLLVQLEEQEAVFLQVNKPDQWLVYRLENDEKLVSYFWNENEPLDTDDVFTFVRQKRNVSQEFPKN